MSKIVLTDEDRCTCVHWPSDHHPTEGCIHCGACTEYVRRGGPRPEIEDRMRAERERALAGDPMPKALAFRGRA